ncbi:PREDICTED: uncharacterized protein LOC109117253 [Tarenaya hassleriana]|uniref:uncharacterized protein LOC109117253 n=1 Tax=Tarenaya hassleriana TaxID=28532 RepID=UPI0008FD86B9|nr:PREDICTED: uncharacterized protein LOC109117253 [Tarenaya hassleriana]XP_019059607.1 PREDICTED: uncharacterized protein LOC109117253 [Tarenaya hassleriana]
MGREQNPGLKILWIWTFGTAAILVTNVVRTRLRDMEAMMNQGQRPDQNQRESGNAPESDSVLTDGIILSESDREIAEELK